MGVLQRLRTCLCCLSSFRCLSACTAFALSLRGVRAVRDVVHPLPFTPRRQGARVAILHALGVLRSCSMYSRKRLLVCAQTVLSAFGVVGTLLDLCLLRHR